MKRSTTRHASGSNLLITALTSIFVVIALLFCAGMISQNNDAISHSKSDVKVYCAAGIANTIRQITDQFNTQHDFQVRIERVGGSGELGGQIKSEFETKMLAGADILISNDDQLLKQAEFSNLFVEVVDLTTQRPVIAVRSQGEIEVDDLKTMLTTVNLKFGVASRYAAVGKLTRQLAEQANLLDDLEAKKTIDAENVMVLAQALVIGSLDAAVIWDTTVLQINSAQDSAVLKVASAADNSDQAECKTVIGIVNKKSNSIHSTQTGKFVNFLLSKDSQRLLKHAGYQPIAPAQKPIVSNEGRDE